MSDAPVLGLPGEPPAQVVDTLVADKVASRITSRDATLWGPGAQDEAAVRLGWVALHESSRPLLAEIEALQAELRADGLDHVVLCGMGGSSLAPEVITASAGVELTVLDTTDPGPVRRALADRLDRTAVVVSSKSGTTVETDSQRRAFEAAFRDAGIDPGPRFVAVTDEGSPLAELAKEAGYRRVFLADPAVGGRYSALTSFGLVPSGLAGAGVDELLDDAAAVAPVLATDDPDNPALSLGALLADRRAVAPVAAAGAGIVGFADWVEQLIAESTGKDGTGVLPLVVPEAQGPDVGASPYGGVPPVEVGGPLGAQFLLWEYATAVAGRLLGINPFDQPDVESAKKAARGFLDAPPEPQPADFVDGAVEVRGTDGLLDGVDTLPGALQALLDRLSDVGYLAVMAYLDRTGDDAAAAGVRAPLAARSGRPVTFGWGPRFLHSTGQYHKGGPPTGVFLQVTGEVAEDLPIPGRPFTFGQLIAAQAAGDAEVLGDLGRPVLRLHLTDRAAGIDQLLTAVGG
ncbi:MAG: glucose-6-phosphate isomerase [Actinomycetota bacterium]